MFSDKLRKLRRQKNLTQNELGKILNVSNGTIGMWETGKREPDIQTITKIANYFDVSIDYLLEFSKNSNFESVTNKEKVVQIENSAFGENIRRLRRDKNWTQAELGKKLNLSSVAVALWETGKREPDMETINRLANIFGVSVDFLTGRENPITVTPKKMVARTFSPEQMKVLEELLQAIKDENDNH